VTRSDGFGAECDSVCARLLECHAADGEAVSKPFAAITRPVMSSVPGTAQSSQRVTAITLAVFVSRQSPATRTHPQKPDSQMADNLTLQIGADTASLTAKLAQAQVDVRALRRRDAAAPLISCARPAPTPRAGSRPSGRWLHRGAGTESLNYRHRLSQILFSLIMRGSVVSLGLALINRSSVWSSMP
jgi:hypothetical protein